MALNTNLIGNTLQVDAVQIMSGPTGTALTIQPLIYAGSGAPTFTAPANSLYIRTDGSSTATRLYSNTTGSTTWTNFTSAA